MILTVTNEYGSDRTLTYINVNKGGGIGGEYCATANTRNYVYIDQVTFGDIVNNSTYSANDYGDFTNMTTSVEVGKTYPLAVRATKNWPYNQVRVWVDWNQDGDFDDLEEELLYQDNSSTFSANITIPSSAKLGGARMRVRLGYDLLASPQPCGTDDTGEVEDYTILVTPPGAVADFSSDKSVIDVNQQINFVDLSSNNPTNWSWTFEGGTPTTSNQQNPAVSYNTPGTYQVSLTIKNKYGSDSILTHTSVVQKYCSTVNTRNDIYVGEVGFGNITNSSDYAPNGYGDFTNISTSAEIGQVYTLTVKMSQFSKYNQAKAWADWNQDGDFDNSGEELFYQSNKSIFSAPITIPSDAKLGGTRLRIRTGYGLRACILSKLI